MDPSAVAPHVHDDTTLATLVGVAMVVLEVGKKLVAWVAGKVAERWFDGDSKRADSRSNGSTQLVVRLDPEASHAISEILNKVERVEEIVDRRDADGIPLAYFPRSVEVRLHEDIESVGEQVQLVLQKAK